MPPGMSERKGQVVSNIRSAQKTLGLIPSARARRVTIDSYHHRPQ